MPRAEDPMMLLLDAMMRSHSGESEPSSRAIEAQEARGQAELVANMELPCDSKPPLSEAAANIPGLESAGAPSRDGMFMPIKLPSGWRKERTDHSMWSKLVDDQGRERAAIFYKAAIYDRSAHMTWSRRYGFTSGYGDDGVVGVTDAMKPGEYLFTAGTVDPNAEYSRDCYAAREKMQQQCAAWLNENHPEWQSPWAYWDQE